MRYAYQTAAEEGNLFAGRLSLGLFFNLNVNESEGVK